MKTDTVIWVCRRECLASPPHLLASLADAVSSYAGWYTLVSDIVINAYVTAAFVWPLCRRRFQQARRLAIESCVAAVVTAVCFSANILIFMGFQRALLLSVYSSWTLMRLAQAKAAGSACLRARSTRLSARRASGSSRRTATATTCLHSGASRLPQMALPPSPSRQAGAASAPPFDAAGIAHVTSHTRLLCSLCVHCRIVYDYAFIDCHDVAT